MIVLGLDPGIARTGFGLLDTDQPSLFVSCGCLVTKTSQETPERLGQLGDDLTALIKQFKPGRAVVEEIYFGTNIKTAMLTAQARGVLVYILRSHGIEIITLTPLQIKSKLTGFGRASKQQVQTVVQQRLRLSAVPSPDDAADALAAALCVFDNKYNKATISA